MRRYGLCAGLGVGLLLLGGATTPVAAQAIGNPLWEIPVKSLAATRERPVFSPSRRPPPPAPLAAPYVPPQVPAKPASPQLTLLGTVLGAADKNNVSNAADGIGVFLDQTNNTVVRMKAGDHHNGWLLRSVQGREATLQNGRDAVVLFLPARGSEEAGSSYVNTNTDILAVQESKGPPALKSLFERYH